CGEKDADPSADGEARGVSGEQSHRLGWAKSIPSSDATEVKISMATTHTGTFPIGFRRGWTQWQKDLAALSRWAKAQEFEAMDLGAHIFFTCIIPTDPTAPRAENYKLAVESFAPIADACAGVGAALAIEGWPGSAPHLANLCCTPETVRAFLKDVGPGAGINYDPSHLIRLGVDHVRFLQEFLPNVHHVHAKDTQLFDDARYEFGSPPATFAKPHGFGEWTWRYT